jgi:hypothetical protein
MKRSDGEDSNIFFDFIFDVNKQLSLICRKRMRCKDSLFYAEEALTAGRQYRYGSNEKPTNLRFDEHGPHS